MDKGVLIKNDINVEAYLLETNVNTSPRDPDVIFHDGFFYHCLAYNNELYIKKSPSIAGLLNAEKHLVFTPHSPFNQEVWAPELHIVNDKCYIYVAIDDGDNNHHRMFVLANDSSNPLSPFRLVSKISDKTDKWAIDGTLLKYHNELYFVWSGWESNENVRQNIYIAHMDSPTHVDSERVMISTPTYEWEKRDAEGVVGKRPFVNEGPYALYGKESLYIIYSASGSWGNNYCLGALRFKGGDILNASNWEKIDKPLFKKTRAAKGPGHASFIQNSPDGKIYMAYHIFNRDASYGWQDTKAIIQEVKLVDDYPLLGEPLNIDL